jgi:hypothetical protein
MIVASARRSMRWHESDAAHWVVDGGERCFALCVQGAYARKRPVLPLFFLASTCVIVVEECVCKNQGLLTGCAMWRAETAFNGSGTVEIAC